MSVANRLRGDRVIAAKGQLSLDRDKAREKLRMFRLADPHFYVLQFVRAASVLGAPQIVFEISASEMTCRFSRVIPSELLEDIWGVAFEQREGAAAQAAHYVALGLGSAQALDPKVIEIRSGEFCLRIEGDEESTTHGHDDETGTSIYVREKFRFGHLVEFFSTIGTSHAETVALRQRCEFAQMPVVVNGKYFQRDVAKAHQHVQTFDGPTEHGFAAINPLAPGDGWCVVLRDSVAIGRQPITVQGAPVVGVIQSSRVRTDLSGLGPIADGAWVDVIRQVFIPNYHLALRLWLQTESEQSRLETLPALLDYVRLHPTEHDTIALLDWLLDLPLFEVATGQGRSSLKASLSNDRSLRFSRERFDLKVEGPPTLLIERTHGGGGGVERIRERTVKEAILDALRRQPDVAIRDRTHELKRRVRAGRNEALWRSRPLREFPTHPFQETVTVDGALGNVFIPVDEPDGTLDTAECGFSVFVRSRLVSHRPNELGLGIGYDGDFRLNRTFDGIDSSERQHRLAKALCVRTLDLFQTYAEFSLERNVAEQSRPRRLDEFVDSLLSGTWSTRFFDALGYLPAVAQSMSEDLTQLAWFAKSRPVLEVIERLGPIAQVASYDLASGGQCSLAEIAAGDELSLLRPVGDWRAFLSSVREELGLSALSSIVLVDEVQARIVRSVRPQTPDAWFAIEQIRANKLYMARPVFDDRMAEDLVAAEATVERHGVKITLRLVPTDALRKCETVLIWRDRVLATHSLDVKRGAFRAVVRSERLVPTADYTDVETGPWFAELLEITTAAALELVDKWWAQRRASSERFKSSELELIWSLALGRARYEPDSAMIPVMRSVDGLWVDGWASRTELRADAAANGLVSACSRTDRAAPGVAPSASGPVLRIPPGMNVRRLRGLLGKDVRVVDATPTRLSGPDAYEGFRQISAHPQRIRGGAVSCNGDVRGLRYHCAIFPDASAGTAKQVNIVKVLYEKRPLETLEVEVPFGQFRCIIQGELIEPDPSYSFVAGGRAEVLDAARRAAAATIREACRLVTLAGGPVGDLAAIGLDLERMLEICQQHEPDPPFDLRAMLFSTLLAGEPQPSDVSAEADDPFAEIEEPPIDLVPSLPKPAARARPVSVDPLLAGVVGMLLDARADRRDLFDDHLARAFQWESLDGPLCSVSNTGVAIDPAHALVRRAREIGDRGALAFVASTVYSRINAHYRRIADHDELELQARLVRGLRG